jgi:hypothetical protein
MGFYNKDTVILKNIKIFYGDLKQQVSRLFESPQNQQ